LVTAIQGLAAGSMLTMIAQTMIPEAVHLGGANVVGLSTLMGFLSAVAFKLLQVK
jgi:zinc transporter ZupT